MMKKVLITILIILIVFQFIGPPKNNSEGISSNDISLVYGMPDAVHQVLVQKCYDCHSNSTYYPWYSNIQPIGWWLYSHIREGKEHLNFSEFGTYDNKKSNHKLEELSEAVTEGWMPLESYVWMHPQTKITPQETEMINNWIQSTGVEIKKSEE